MKYKLKLIIFLILVTIIGSGWVYFRYFFDLVGKCSKSVISEQYSPKKEYYAQDLSVLCGATSADAEQILIKNISTGNEDTVLSIKKNQAISCNMTWLDDSILDVSCMGGIGQGYFQKNKFEKIDIHYIFNEK